MKTNRTSRGMNTKLRGLAVIGILAMLLSLLFNPAISHAQTSASGTVVAFGSDYGVGLTVVPAGLSGVTTAVAAGNDHNLVLKSDGTIVAWGSNTYGQIDVPAGLSGVTTAVAAGYGHSLALKSDGTVVAWGRNNYGQISVPLFPMDVTAIAAHAWHSLALKSDGTVVAWGDNYWGESSVPFGLSGVISIAAGGTHSLALKGDGTVVAWGRNNYGQGSVPSGLSGVIAIAAGYEHNLVLKSDGTVVAWGRNNYGQGSVPSGLSGVTAIAAGEWHNLAVNGDGTVVAWGNNESGQTVVPVGLSGVTALAAGQFHNLALISTAVPGPDLAITQVADQETVSTGDPMGFTITVTNNGATANNVTLSDTLPVYNEFSWSVSGTDAAACALTAGTLSCNFGDMLPGAVKTIRLTAPEYVYYGKCFSPIITSTATLMAYNQPVNKTATASVTVLCPYAYLDLWSDTYNVMAGDPVSYTVTIGNQGDGNAKDVEAFLDLQTPSGMSWVITEVTPSSAASNCALELDGTWTELTCLFDQITPQEEVIIKFTSPTTSESCGTFGAAGGMRASNFVGFKTKGYYLTVNCTVSHTAQPGDAGTLTLLNGRGQVDFPADLVTVPTTFTYTKQDTPSQNLGSYRFAGISFTLTAIDSAGSPVTTFPASYTMRLTYQDSDWQAAGITDESLLNLAYWDTASGQWMSLLPCEGCALDTAQNTLVVKLNHLTEFALLAPTDTTPPATSASLSPEVGSSGWYTGPVTVTLTASDSGLGVQTTEYNLNGAGWTIYSVPFEVSTESTSSTVHNTVQYRSTDKAGNVEETKSLTIKIDTTAPAIGASVPLSGYAVQGGIKFSVSLADALSGPASAMLSIREADGTSGKEIGYENMATVFNSTTGSCELAQRFDTTQVPDGFYVLVATGKDVAGNEKTEIIPFSVRNWAVLELLPSTEDNKAGRTMPVKFSLRVVQEVDPDQPFVYSEELTIKIYETGKPTPVLQRSIFGSDARDYRISAAQQTYITNFPTLRKTMRYTVEILRGALSIGTFGFQTTK